MAFFKILEMSKRKIKQEVDLVLLFELISIGNVKQSNQIDAYLTSIVVLFRNQPIKLYNAWSKVGAVFARCYRRAENSEGLRVIFGEYSDIVQTDILTIQRFLDISRFCTPVVGRQVGGEIQQTKTCVKRLL